MNTQHELTKMRTHGFETVSSGLSEHGLILWAVNSARVVLHTALFDNPDDERPLNAILSAEGWLNNPYYLRRGIKPTPLFSELEIHAYNALTSTGQSRILKADVTNENLGHLVNSNLRNKITLAGNNASCAAGYVAYAVHKYSEDYIGNLERGSLFMDYIRSSIGCSIVANGGYGSEGHGEIMLLAYEPS